LTYSTYPFYLFYSFFPFYSSDYFGQTLSLESLIISETDGLQNHSGGNEIQIYLIYLTYPFYSFYSSFPFYLFYSLVSRMGLGLTTDIVTQHGSSWSPRQGVDARCFDLNQHSVYICLRCWL